MPMQNIFLILKGKNSTEESKGNQGNKQKIATMKARQH